MFCYTRYVNQVFVKDVHTDKSWTFVYNDWLAVDRGNLLMTTATLQSVTEASRHDLEDYRKNTHDFITKQVF